MGQYYTGDVARARDCRYKRVKYFIQTFGCQMNVHDSDRMGEVLVRHGHESCESVDVADVIIFNTCSVREKAEQKLRSEVGKLKELKQQRPDALIVVAGCVAQQEGQNILARISHVDIVIGPDNIAELPRLLEEQVLGGPPVVRTVFDNESPSFLAASPAPGQTPVSAFITTMKGCDERCTFCIVPTTRGSERYRPAHEIVSEAQRWIAAGAREIMLLGQTVDSYRDASLPAPASSDPDESQFPHLLRLLAREVPGMLRLRYTSPHPRHATASLCEAHRDLDVLAEHIHMPMQSGSDRVLRRMSRRYTRADYVARVSALAKSRADITLSTDIIVGFPSETDDDFEATLSLVREMNFVSLFAYKYSPRPFTPALKLGDDVPETVKSERLARLLALADEQSARNLNARVGSSPRVLIDGPSKTANKQGGLTFQGRTQRNEIVHVTSDRDIVGREVRPLIVRANKHSLQGELSVEEAASLPAYAPKPKTTRAHLEVLA
jgi:tRNA-2-methylthio-N6-dimethylallyladenosine synthase